MHSSSGMHWPVSVDDSLRRVSIGDHLWMLNYAQAQPSDFLLKRRPLAVDVWRCGQFTRTVALSVANMLGAC